MIDVKQSDDKIPELYQLYQNSTGVCIDTRKLKRGNIYFALKGENFDGNIFAQKALELGALAVVIDEKSCLVDSDDRYSLVTNTLKSLQELARYHRSKLTIPIIGITGSNGKTTTKELLFSVLSKNFNTYATKGNFNNHIGVPLTILDISKDIDIAIVEMGANHIAEIEFLCSISNPTHGVITNIGKAHLEGFGSIENIKIGKSELYKYLAKNNGLVFLQATDPILGDLIEAKQNKITIDALPNIQNSDTFPYLEFIKDARTVKTNLTGAYNISNISVAYSIGDYFGVEQNDILDAIEDYTPVNNRSQVKVIEDKTFILDSYNANPSSMRKSIENMILGDPKQITLVLGDMKELGDVEVMEHEQIVNFIKKYPWKQVFLVGEVFSSLNIDTSYKTFNDVMILKDYLNSNPIEEGHILLKGSRSIGLEKLLD